MTATMEIKSRSRVVEKKEFLFPANVSTDSVFVVTKGALVRERVLSNGRSHIIGLYVPGDTCGLASLSDGYNLDGVSALTTSTVEVIDRRSLLSAAQESHGTVLTIWREMRLESELHAAWAVNIGQRAAYNRIAYLMCELASRLSKSTRLTNVQWPGTQSDLSAATGLSVVHVNRTLKQLAEAGLLHRKLIFTNLDELRHIVDFDPQLEFHVGRLSDLILSSPDATIGRSSQLKPGSPGILGDASSSAYRQA